MTDKLKPCPFCGSAGVGAASCHPMMHCGNGVFEEDINVTNWKVICGNCGASTDVESSKSNAKRKWNRRAGLPQGELQVLHTNCFGNCGVTLKERDNNDR